MRTAHLTALVFFLSFQASAADQIRCTSYFDMSEHSGQTYLSFMETAIRPAMIELVKDGYDIKDSEAIEEAYDLVAWKIRNRIDRNWGGLDNVISINEQIASELRGETTNMHELPDQIRDVDRDVDRFGLSTFLGLANGGCVTIKYHDNNYSHNVHYDTTNERSGRSFGVGPGRKANDASDKAYLDDIEEYVLGEETAENIDKFYSSLFDALLDSRADNYQDIADLGQAVLSDFLAVYTAEQARNLMDERIHPHWDAALLEVTLLAAFHAGQEDGIKMYYRNPETRRVSFTKTTLRQTPCRYPDAEQEARLRDYWQFSRNINGSGCRRSGINITRREFRKLGGDITNYMFRNHFDEFAAVRDAMDLRSSYNVFSSLSNFLIDSDTPKSFEEEKRIEVRDAWVNFLMKVREEAPSITRFIERRN